MRSATVGEQGRREAPGVRREEESRPEQRIPGDWHGQKWLCGRGALSALARRGREAADEGARVSLIPGAIHRGPAANLCAGRPSCRRRRCVVKAPAGPRHTLVKPLADPLVSGEGVPTGETSGQQPWRGGAPRPETPTEDDVKVVRGPGSGEARGPAGSGRRVVGRSYGHRGRNDFFSYLTAGIFSNDWLRRVSWIERVDASRIAHRGM